MNLYMLFGSPEEKYDSYDSVIVAAPTRYAASKILPHPDMEWGQLSSEQWAPNAESVKVSYIGVAAARTKEGVVLASFNAG